MLPSRVTPGKSVICQRVKDEAVLLDMSTQQYFGLNGTGVHMWDLLVELGDSDAVVTALEARFNVSRKVLEADLEVLVRQLIDANLLQAA